MTEITRAWVYAEQLSQGEIVLNRIMIEHDVLNTTFSIFVSGGDLNKHANTLIDAKKEALKMFTELGGGGEGWELV